MSDIFEIPLAPIDPIADGIVVVDGTEENIVSSVIPEPVEEKVEEEIPVEESEEDKTEE